MWERQEGANPIQKSISFPIFGYSTAFFRTNIDETDGINAWIDGRSLEFQADSFNKREGRAEKCLGLLQLTVDFNAVSYQLWFVFEYIIDDSQKISEQK